MGSEQNTKNVCHDYLPSHFYNDGSPFSVNVNRFFKAKLNNKIKHFCPFKEKIGGKTKKFRPVVDC